MTKMYVLFGVKKRPTPYFSGVDLITFLWNIDFMLGCSPLHVFPASLLFMMFFLRGKEMRKFVVMFKSAGPELWRSAAIEKAIVKAPNVPMAVYEFHKKYARATCKMTVTEVYEHR